tara:strand:- start:812 stop:988 length:177 start_codon:yes stop_codon:yes gene_type:complete
MNEEMKKKLTELVFTGALPESTYQFLKDLGNSGTISDMLAKEGGYKAFTEWLLAQEGA